MYHNPRVGALIAAGILLLVEASAWAHHSASQYDGNVTVTLTGTLTKVNWTNPHIEFLLDVTDNTGQTTSWLIESDAPNRYVGRAVDKAVFIDAIGQSATVEINPQRDGSPFGILVQIIFADGSVGR